MPAKASVIRALKRLAEEPSRAEPVGEDHDDAGERDGRGDERARRDALAVDEPADRRRDEGQASRR